VLKKDSYKVNYFISSSTMGIISSPKLPEYSGIPGLPLKKSRYTKSVSSPARSKQKINLTSLKIQCNVNKIEGGITKIQGEIDELKKKIPYTVKPTQLLG
jgi:hypothetical protein